MYDGPEEYALPLRLSMRDYPDKYFYSGQNVSLSRFVQQIYIV